MTMVAGQVADEVIAQIARELSDAQGLRTVLPRITARYPDMTINDSYAVQRIWRDQQVAAGRRPIGHKIGLTSKAMQAATGIDEPDYGVMFADTVWDSGAEIPFDSFCNVRVEVELAFVLDAPLNGPDCTLRDVLGATRYVVPALEILNSHLELAGRTVVDTIADNAAFGALVLGGNPVRPDRIDMRWVAAMLYRNATIEETGVAAGVLGHPGIGVAWLANKLAAHGDHLEAGEVILSGSFTRPVSFTRGDTALADYGPLGTVSCRFV